MRVAVTGAGGLLAATLVPLWRRAGADVTAWSRAELDVTDADAVRRTIRAARPGIVVHAAAWTDVDGAEAEPARCLRVNGEGTRNVAAACAEAGALLAYPSTDYVFHDAGDQPISPLTPPSPRGAYARSKVAGEAAVGTGGLVVRTGWLYGPGGPNFVDTMRAAAREGREARVVDDQVGAPTSARLVAEALWGLARAARRGVWHVTAAGRASWYEVARGVYRAAGADPDLVRPCASAELGRAAPRPPCALLDGAATEQALGGVLPAWEPAVARYVATGALEASGLMREAA